MSAILVLLQQENSKILKASLSALAAARSLQEVWKKGALIGITFGKGAQGAADAALEWGFDEVLFVDTPAFERYLGAVAALALQQAASQIQADTIVGAASSVGKDLFARVAALLNAGQASDITGVNPDGTLRRPMYAGDVFADVELTNPARVVTVRASGFAPAPTVGKKGAARAFAPTVDPAKYGEVLSYELSKAERPQLGEAEVVVSGGRALQSAENFEKIMFPLADAFGAAVGASRAAVDSGYAPNDWQVGQTGKIVAPQLYVAVGISGAIQHLAGMKDSKVIVALNKDPDAPIFEVADYGLVADLYDAVPKLTAAVKAIKAR